MLFQPVGVNRSVTAFRASSIRKISSIPSQQIVLTKNRTNWEFTEGLLLAFALSNDHSTSLNKKYFVNQLFHFDDILVVGVETSVHACNNLVNEMLVASFEEQIMLLLECSEQVLDQRCLVTGVHSTVEIEFFNHRVVVVTESLFNNFPHVLEQLSLKEKWLVTFF